MVEPFRARSPTRLRITRAPPAPARLLAPLFLDEVAQLPLHRLERVVDHFVERLVRTVVFLLFVRDEFVTRSDGDIDSATIGISFVMRVVGLLDHDVAAVNVIAKFVEARCINHHEIVDLL